MGTVTGMTAEYINALLADKVDVAALSESIDDRVQALIIEGSGITKAYDDTANTLTLSASGGGVSSRTECTTTGLTVTSTTMGGQDVRIVRPTGWTFVPSSEGGGTGPSMVASTSFPRDFSPVVAGFYNIRIRCSLQWGVGGPDGLHWQIVTTNEDFHLTRPTLPDHPAYVGGETKAYRDTIELVSIYLDDATTYDRAVGIQFTTPGTVSPAYVGSGAILVDMTKVG